METKEHKKAIDILRSMAGFTKQEVDTTLYTLNRYLECNTVVLTEPLSGYKEPTLNKIEMVNGDFITTNANEF